MQSFPHRIKPKMKHFFFFWVMQYTITIHCITLHFNTIQCKTIQCNAMQCNAMQCNAMQCNAMQYNTIQYNTIQYNTIHGKIEICQGKAKTTKRENQKILNVYKVCDNLLHNTFNRQSGYASQIKAKIQNE